MRSGSKKSRDRGGSPRFLVDECVSRTVLEALRGAGENVETIIDRYQRRGVTDETFLPEAGRERLIVISKDDRIQRNESQIALLRQYRVLFFALAPTDPPMRREEQAHAVMTALPHIKKMVLLKSAERGILARIGREGHVARAKMP